MYGVYVYIRTRRTHFHRFCTHVMVLKVRSMSDRKFE